MADAAGFSRASSSTSPDVPSPSDANGAAKASRTKRACVQCFKAKVRCSGDHPCCTRCAHKQSQCYYDPTGNHRAKKPRRDPPPAAPRPAPPPAPRQASTSRTSPATATATATVTATPSMYAHEDHSPDEGATTPVAIRQPFFRWLGLTSILPPQQGPQFRSFPVAVRGPDTQSPPTHDAASPPVPPLRDPAIESAEAEVRIRTFYTLFESYLPYMPLRETLDRLARGTLSEVVIAAMSALVKRVRPETPGPSAEQLADRAKSLVIAHLALPSLDTIYALLLLAYHEHGADRDSGLWAYSGMAIRACVDLGLHKSFEANNPAETALRSRIFWAVACLDRIVSCGTGRLTTIPLSQIEVSLPPPRDTVRTTQGASLPDPFPTLCRLLLISGNMSDAVNTTSSLSAHPQVPVSVQLELAEFQASLPEPLHFSIHTFSAYVNAGHAQAFLLLSLWHQAVHLAIHEAALLFAHPATVGSPPSAGADMTPLSGSSAISIADMLAYSSVILDDAFLCNPTLSQPIMMAGRAAYALLKTLPASTPRSEVEPLERSVTICQKTLERMQQPWRGLSWHVESMTKSAREVDLHGKVGATITTADKGMLTKAKLDDLTRSCSWLLDELSSAPTESGEVVGVGLSSWGITSDPAPPPHLQPPPQSTVAVLRSGRSSPILWNDQSGDLLSTFAHDMNGFWSGEWLAGPGQQGAPGGSGVGREDPLEHVLGLPPHSSG